MIQPVLGLTPSGRCGNRNVQIRCPADLWYGYCLDDPVNMIDPSGLMGSKPDEPEEGVLYPSGDGQWQSNPGACEKCRKYDGNYYAPGSEPEEPHPNCKCEVVECFYGSDYTEWKEVEKSEPVFDYPDPVVFLLYLNVVPIVWTKSVNIKEIRTRTMFKLCGDRKDILGTKTEHRVRTVEETRFSKHTKFSLTILIMEVFGLCLAHVAHAQDIQPEDFLNPLPGYVFYYETSHGQKMNIHGLTRDEAGCLIIEETTFFPVETELRGKCINQLSETYGLCAEGNLLLRKGFSLASKDSTRMQLDTEQQTWGNPFTWMPYGARKKSEGTPMVSKCRILKTSKQLLYGKERTVIEVGGEFCPERVYASGIGLIDYVGFKLVRIEKHGKTVKKY